MHLAGHSRALDERDGRRGVTARVRDEVVRSFTGYESYNSSSSFFRAPFSILVSSYFRPTASGEFDKRHKLSWPVS